MSNSTVFNTTDSPVVLDDVGTSIGGGEWRDVDTQSPHVKDALDRGYLVEVKKPASDDSKKQTDDREAPKQPSGEQPVGSKPKTRVGGKKNEER